MPFWRRRPDAPATPETEVDPEAMPADWEPDPSDFDDPIELLAVEPEGPERELDHEPEPVPGPSVLRIEFPPPPPVEPAPAWPEPVKAAEPALPPAESDTAAALDAGLERTRGGFMSRLRGILGTGDAEGPSWDDVEETLIAGDVGAALAIDLVERARRRRGPGGPEAAIRAELAALLVPRDLDWSPRSAVSGGPAVVLVVGVNGTGKTTTIGKLASRYAGRAARSSWPPPTRSAPPRSTSSGSGPTGPASR